MGPDGDGPSAKDHIYFFFFFFFLLLLQGTSIGLVQTNTALLSLVDTNRVQYTFIEQAAPDEAVWLLTVQTCRWFFHAVQMKPCQNCR